MSYQTFGASAAGGGVTGPPASSLALPATAVAMQGQDVQLLGITGVDRLRMPAAQNNSIQGVNGAAVVWTVSASSFAIGGGVGDAWVFMPYIDEPAGFIYWIARRSADSPDAYALVRITLATGATAIIGSTFLGSTLTGWAGDIANATQPDYGLTPCTTSKVGNLLTFSSENGGSGGYVLTVDITTVSGTPVTASSFLTTLQLTVRGMTIHAKLASGAAVGALSSADGALTDYPVKTPSGAVLGIGMIPADVRRAALSNPAGSPRHLVINGTAGERLVSFNAGATVVGAKTCILVSEFESWLRDIVQSMGYTW